LSSSQKILIGIPIYNEEQFLSSTFEGLEPILQSYPYSYILLFDDGSTDSTPEIIKSIQEKWPGRIINNRHQKSKGYGKTIIDILRFGCENKDKYDIVVTFDADMQHDPKTIPSIITKMELENHIDIVSTSRYLDPEMVAKALNVPYDRFLVNMNLTKLINILYNYKLTDSFCGLKGYRVCRVERMFRMRDVGYSSPLEFWINAAYHDLFIDEVPTSLIYVDERRGRGSWTERLNDYLNSFFQYAWADDQKRYINEIRPKMIYFIDKRLEEFSHSVDLDRSPVSSFAEFWHLYNKESPFFKFSPQNIISAVKQRQEE
jgi:glycosyltransferase involved in cell wall biosynthesis